MIKLNFFGDLNFGDQFVEKPFTQIADTLHNSDINIANFEGPLSEKVNNNKKVTCYSYKDNILNLTSNNFKIVNLANNHITDLGPLGFDFTIKEFKKEGISFFGAGDNLKSSINPYIINVDKINIGFLGFGWNVIGCQNAKKNLYGVAPLNEKIIFEAIKQTKSLCDFIVVSLHFGYEFEKLPLPNQRKLCHNIIDWGADLIIGHHPHILQGIEKYKNKYIAYSLGNFLFADVKINNQRRKWEQDSKESIIFQCNISDSLIIDSISIIPICFDEDLKVQYFKNDSMINKKIEILSEPLSLDYISYLEYWKNHRNRNLVNPLNNYFLTKSLNNSKKVIARIFKN